MITTTTKQKGGVQFIYNGTPVWLHRDKGDGTAAIRYCPSKLDAEIVDVVSFEDLSPVKKAGKGIVSKPRILNSEEKSVKDDLNGFYDDIAMVMPFNCMECDKPLYAYNKFAKRSCTSHLLPKGLFPSIATNVHNIVFLGPSILGICNCHNRWDDRDASHREAMRIYPEAILSFNNYLKHELTEHEFIRACDYLGIDYKDYE